jgi:septal ring factor EnvC (AmiA/AmiB activator)
MKNVYDYLVARYGQRNAEPNLYMMINNLQERMNVLEDKYQDALRDIKRLEEENIETTNSLYEVMNSIDAVDHRIDILYGEQQ